MKRAGYPFIRFMLYLCIVLCAGCEKEDTTDILDYQVFNECLYSKEVTLEEASHAVMEQYGITDDMISPFKKQIEALFTLPIRYDVHAIAYHTISPDGKDVIASGVVYYPCNRQPAGVIEISPVNKSKGGCGTEEYLMAEVLPGMVAGYICIVPDLIGCGKTADLPISYLQHDNTAIVSADMRKATAEFVWNTYGVKLPEKSILFGYSLGGACVMSLARLYQLDPSHGVEVSHIFCGGGAYEPLEVVKSQLDSDRSDYAIIPNIIRSMDYYDHLHLDYKSIFKGDLLDHYEEWCDGYVSITELTEILGTQPSLYLSDEIVSSYDSSDQFAPLMKALIQKTIPRDWVPKAEIHLYHSAFDYYVPTICGDRLYQHLKEDGAQVTYKKYNGSHIFSGLLMEFDFLDFLQDLNS